MGIKLMDEDQYKYLSTSGIIGDDTMSWLDTPEEVIESRDANL
ncbi:MAG: hypothetical protein ACI9QC_000806 [Oceanicoccus sp.]|jgi:hypothetical protein